MEGKNIFDAKKEREKQYFAQTRASHLIKNYPNLAAHLTRYQDPERERLNLLKLQRLQFKPTDAIVKKAKKKARKVKRTKNLKGELASNLRLQRRFERGERRDAPEREPRVLGQHALAGAVAAGVAGGIAGAGVPPAGPAAAVPVVPPVVVPPVAVPPVAAVDPRVDALRAQMDQARAEILRLGRVPGIDPAELDARVGLIDARADAIAGQLADVRAEAGAGRAGLEAGLRAELAQVGVEVDARLGEGLAERRAALDERLQHHGEEVGARLAEHDRGIQQYRREDDAEREVIVRTLEQEQQARVAAEERGGAGLADVRDQIREQQAHNVAYDERFGAAERDWAAQRQQAERVGEAERDRQAQEQADFQESIRAIGRRAAGETAAQQRLTDETATAMRLEMEEVRVAGERRVGDLEEELRDFREEHRRRAADPLPRDVPLDTDSSDEEVADEALRGAMERAGQSPTLRLSEEPSSPSPAWGSRREQDAEDRHLERQPSPATPVPRVPSQSPKTAVRETGFIEPPTPAEEFFSPPQPAPEPSPVPSPRGALQESGELVEAPVSDEEEAEEPTMLQRAGGAMRDIAEQAGGAMMEMMSPKQRIAPGEQHGGGLQVPIEDEEGHERLEPVYGLGQDEGEAVPPGVLPAVPDQVGADEGGGGAGPREPAPVGLEVPTPATTQFPTPATTQSPKPARRQLAPEEPEGPGHAKPSARRESNSLWFSPEVHGELGLLAQPGAPSSGEEGRLKYRVRNVTHKEVKKIPPGASLPVLGAEGGGRDGRPKLRMLQQKGGGSRRNLNRINFEEMDRLVGEGKLVFELSP